MGTPDEGQNKQSGDGRTRKAAEVVADHIRGAIIRGDIAEGDSLPAEAHLIATHGVSRPTIREAIRILESEKLLSVSRGARGGAIINRPSLDFISRAMGYSLQAQGTTLGDIYTARCIIEPPAARLAAENRPAEAARVLKRHVDMEFSVLDERPKIAAAVAGFHRLLVEQSGNDTLALLIKALYSISERHMAMVHRVHDAEEDRLFQEKRTRAGFRSHGKLVRLIAAGDGPGAEKHWTEHLARASEYWLRGFGSSGLDILDQGDRPAMMTDQNAA